MRWREVAARVRTPRPAAHAVLAVSVTLPLAAAAAVGCVWASAAAAARVGSPGPAALVMPAGDLYGVAAVSARSAWAVGETDGFGGDGLSRTLIETWDGRIWTRVRSPDPAASGGDCLYDVVVGSAGSAWAVGNTGNRTLIVRWSGRAWSQVPSLSPSPRRDVDVLYAVAVGSARSAWAVGSVSNAINGDSRTLIDHWNGRTWTRVPSPNPADDYGGDALYGVAATAGGAWAVGGTGSGQTLILRCDGRTWGRVRSPNPDDPQGGDGDRLGAVAVTSARSAWAVGGNGNGGTLIERWNGRTWKHVASPSPASPGPDFLSSVAATSARNAWAVGSSILDIGTFNTIVVRWNGSTWKRVRSPRFLTGDNTSAVAATSARNAWAVGGTDFDQPWIVRWNGRTWKRARAARL